MGETMSKETFYFKHDYNARHDRKLVNVIMNHGMIGIGVYWCVVEMLYEEGGYLPLNKQEYERISFELRADIEIIESIINDFGLFLVSTDTKLFFSDTILSRLQERCDKSYKARASINKRWNKLVKHTNVIRPKQQRNTRRREEKREEEKKEENNTPPKGVFILPSWIPEETWKAYLEVRNKKRAAKTTYALNLIIKELEKYKPNQLDNLNQSIKNGWTDIYPMKENGNGTGKKIGGNTYRKFNNDRELDPETAAAADKINEEYYREKAAIANSKNAKEALPNS